MEQQAFNRRNPDFDVLRGTLASWIVILHALWFAGVSGGAWAASGRMAVDAFIVLSGYLVSKSLLQRPVSALAFVYARFMRLFPAFVCALALAILLRPLTRGKVGSEWTREASESANWFSHIAAHLSLMFGLVPQKLLPFSSIAFLPTAWSISLEMQLYVLTPALLWTVSRWGERAATIGLGISAIAFVPQIAWRLHDWISPMGAFFPQRLFWFVLGLCLALGFESLWQEETLCWLIRLPGAKTLAKLGTVSYAWYLLHYPVLHVIRAALPGTNPLWACVMLQLGIGFPVSVGLAYLLTRYVERPCIALGKK